MLQITAQLPLKAKFSPPPKKPSTREREYLRSLLCQSDDSRCQRTKVRSTTFGCGRIEDSR